MFSPQNLDFYNERYLLEVDIDTGSKWQKLDQFPSNYSFTIHDSIFKLYPTGSFNFHDPTGQLNEYLTFIDGTNIALNFGVRVNTNLESNSNASNSRPDIILSLPMTILGNANPEQQSQSWAGGLVETRLIHAYAYQQKLLSKAYQDEISNIIKSIVSQNNDLFLTTVIRPTQSKGTFYQSMMQNDKFMLERLLPFAYTSSEFKSPFYMFIDNTSTFNFVTNQYMSRQKSIGEFKLIGKGTSQEVNDQTIVNFYPIQDDVEDFYHTLHRFLFNFDLNASPVEADDQINQFLNTSKPLGIKRDLTGLTSVLQLLDSDLNTDSTTNFNLGLKLANMRDSFHLDKAVIIMSFNPSVSAGKVITLNIPISTDSQKTDYSPRFSKDYLIESCYQKWSGRQGTTIAIVSRKELLVPQGTYSFVSQVVKAG